MISGESVRRKSDPCTREFLIFAAGSNVVATAIKTVMAGLGP